ncbi:ATP-dependent DNA ligase [Streptomyces sp. NBC_01476]|uniref:ATP-dependent DNA ligase n=1 Tax=Streptomyces sp. NBC_01476 TaxID=2903881 RepID=UPI002E301634|nr:hypothetical protein [Streptomyces sp. NBC_01476]
MQNPYPRTCVFDVLILGADSLLRRPYAERRQTLRSLELAGPNCSVPDAVVGRSAQALAHTRAANVEGIVCKDLASVYKPGVRSRSWVKIKNTLYSLVQSDRYPRHRSQESLPMTHPVTDNQVTT